MNICYRVEPSETERSELQAMLSGGKHAARKLKRAQILLAADAGVPDEDIARSVVAGGSTVYRTKRRLVEGNLEQAPANVTARSEPLPIPTFGIILSDLAGISLPQSGIGSETPKSPVAEFPGLAIRSFRARRACNYLALGA